MDEIAAYKSKLHEALKKEMAAPISCRSVSNCTMLMDAICAADKLSDKPSTYAQHFEREEAMQWADRMQNADGSTGPHWTMEQTTAIADSMGIPEHEIPHWAWGVTMNMVYSDYYPVAVEFGLNRPEFYAALAKAFLLDKDGPGPERKLMEYYEHIAKRSVQS